MLEYNARFGDPEAQVVLPRMKNDIIDLSLIHIFILRRAADFLIDRIPPEVLAELKQQRRYHSRYRRFCFST